MSELRFFHRNFDRFFSYFFSEFGETSYLARILALFTVRISGKRDINLVVIENVMPATGDIEALFDLKGSKVNRAVVGEDRTATLEERGKVLKDLDFLRLKGRVLVGREDWERFQLQVEKDTSFLESIRSMDYSLLLGLSPQHPPSSPNTLTELPSLSCWYVGLIDYLQEYNVKKHIETVGKLIASPAGKVEDRSCVNPVLYRKRFCEFMRKVVTVE